MIRHNYQKKLEKLIDNGKFPVEAGLKFLTVIHDNSCPALNKGICDCDATFILKDHSTGKETLLEE